jgi:xanthine dehydrogenase accessory factor
MSDTRSHPIQPTRANVLRQARQWLDRDGKVALATVVDTWGSSPVPIGGQMAIAADGRFEGSVSGGCIEGEVIAEAEDVLSAGRPKTLTFGVADETAWRVGLPCGGQVKIFIEPLSRSEGMDLLQRAVEASERREGLVIETRLSDGRHRILDRRTPNLSEDIAHRFRSGESRLRQTPEGDVFVHALLPPARIVVIGATHIAQLVCEIARLADYEVIVIDPRTAFASEERFRGVTVRAEWPQDALPTIGLDPYTALVVVAHVSHIDDEALKIGLRSDCLYIGALGSNRNHAKRKERLKAAGFTEAEIARIKNPIGLDIGSQSPAEIAVAIMAEVILAVRGPKAARSKAAA